LDQAQNLTDQTTHETSERTIKDVNFYKCDKKKYWIQI